MFIIYNLLYMHAISRKSFEILILLYNENYSDIYGFKTFVKTFIKNSSPN